MIAVTSGTEPRIGVGLLTTVAEGWAEAEVATDAAEFVRAGVAGLAGATELGWLGTGLANVEVDLIGD